MANVSKLIFGAILVASISTPALAAHKTAPTAHHNGYVTRTSQGRGVYNFVPVPPSVYNSTAQPHDTPFSGGGF